MGRAFQHIRKTLWLALDHDVFNTAKAAAYSGMLCFFPAVLVVTALLAQVPAGPSLVGEMRGSLDQILPPESMNLLQSSLASAPTSLDAGGFLRRQPCSFCRPGRDAVADGRVPTRLQSSPRQLGFLGEAAARPGAGADRAAALVAGQPAAGVWPPDRGLDHRQRGS